MKKHHKILGVISFLAIGIFLNSCKKDDNSPSEFLTVREAVPSGGNMLLKVKIGTPVQLNLAINPGNKTVKDATYVNKHLDISTFSNSGLLTGVAEGKDTVVITAKPQNISVWYIVDVTK